jgi:hypothetical protein
MNELVIPRHVLRDIVSFVIKTSDGLETGVTIFGTYSSEPTPATCVVLAVAGPGKRSTHEPAHYSGDDDHANAVHDTLRSAMPGIRWLGEFHVHPRGMTWLSSGDKRTVRHILTGTDQTLHPDEFIAGVMQRRNGTVDIYPYHFTRECLEGRAMGVRIVDSDDPVIHRARLDAIEKGDENDRPGICEKPEGSGAAVQKTRGHHWLRKWRERFSRHGRKGRDRQVHADRPRRALP